MIIKQINETELNRYIAIKWLLSIKGIGRNKARKILESFSDFDLIAKGHYQDLKRFEAYFGMPLRGILPYRDFEKFKNSYENNLKFCEGMIDYWSPLYPECLKEIHDPPILMFYKGHIKELLADNNKVAIVGTRVPSEYGRKYGAIISKHIAEYGHTVVSGMAMGIDAVAHKAAIETGGLSFGVLGCGLDQCYPKQNEKLYHSILERGLLLSEYEVGVLPHPIHFPERNRIIAGISDMCIVIEAAKKSGSLITAEMVLDIGRDVYALPGPIYSEKSIGCHELIKNGAIPLVSINDIDEIFERADYNLKPKRNNHEHQLPETHPITSYLMEKGTATLEDIFSNLEIPLDELFTILDDLVADKRIQIEGFLYHL